MPNVELLVARARGGTGRRARLRAWFPLPGVLVRVQSSALWIDQLRAHADSEKLPVSGPQLYPLDFFAIDFNAGKHGLNPFPPQSHGIFSP